MLISSAYSHLDLNLAFYSECDSTLTRQISLTHFDIYFVWKYFKINERVLCIEIFYKPKLDTETSLYFAYICNILNNLPIWVAIYFFIRRAFESDIFLMRLLLFLYQVDAYFVTICIFWQILLVLYEYYKMIIVI